MKKIVALLFVALLLPTFASCAGFMPQGTTAPSTTANPSAALTVTSCTEVSLVNGVRTYRLTFSDGATADFSVKDGATGASPTVVSCTSLGTVDGVTTWRLTFSDNATADFTVTNGSTPEGVDWEGLMERLDAMNDLLTVEAPDMTVGNSTVTNPAKTSPGTYIPSTVTGRGFPLKKSVMFGEDDTVYAIRLNRVGVYKKDDSTLVTSGQVTIEVQIRAYDSTYLASNTTHVKTYVTTVDMKPNMSYIDLPIAISRSDLETIGDDDYFYMNIGVLSEEGDKAIVLSSNSSFHFVSDERENGTEGARLYAGYTVNGIAEKEPSNSYSYNTPDIFFSTAMKSTPVDFSGLLGDNTDNGGDTPSSGNGNVTAPSAENLLQLPEQYDLVVGDPFELFYKGISLCLDSDVFAYELRFSDGKNRGHNYTKKYVWTPEEKDIGVHTLTISVRDNLGNILDTGTVKLNVVNKPQSPEKPLTFLFIGASNNAGGKWSGEVIRRLTASSSTTVSNSAYGLKCDGLTNIETIGTQKKSFDYGDFYYEGYGGWSFESYTTDYSKRPYFVYISGDYSSLALSQHSFYRDSNNQIWKLETIEEERLKLIAVNSVGGNIDTSCKEIPASGSLTLVSGAADDAKTISYTSTAYAEGNPFWSVEKGRNDFLAYAEKHGVESIDEVVVNLGWNSINGSAESFAESARDLIDGILADFPDCHINLVTLALPARDGLGENYGTSWNYYEKCAKAFEFQDALIELSNEEKYGDSVSVISVFGQIDTENGYLTTDRPINNRVPATESMQYNGVHFNDSGHYQQADAIYRHIVTRLQGDR